MRFVWLAAWLLAMVPEAKAAAHGMADGLLDTADSMGLAEQRGWHTLLYLRERLFGPPSSMVDSPAFFLAAAAGWTPRAELRATITTLLTAVAPPERPDDSPACLFAARRQWLVVNLPGFAERAPPADCPGLKAWRHELRTDSVSLVFSSYFADNPSSMFGHSLFRFHKRPHPGKVESGMLDEAISFSAYPTTSNPVLYAAYGLAGRFPGRFSTTPFYMKIQEYNNAESRDLWDYQLALSASDLTMLELVLWEIGPHAINYWYFDENCSLVLLAVLEAANPKLMLAPLHPWVIPSDTLRVLMASPGLVRSVDYRPSALSRFMARYGALTADEKSVTASLIDTNDPGDALFSLQLLPRDSQARVSDAVVEYIDYDEKLAGSKAASVHASLRLALLTRRAKQQEPRVLVSLPPPEDQYPHLPAGTSRLGAGVGYSPQGGTLLQAEWRPAMHDLFEPSLGHAPGLAITFFDTVLRYAETERKAYLERWDLLTIRSVPHSPSLLHPFAWTLDMGVQNLGYCPYLKTSCFVEHVGAGIGPAFTISRATLYGLFGADVGASGEVGLNRYAGPRATVGLLMPCSARSQASFELVQARLFGPHAATRNETSGSAVAALLLNDSSELRLSLERRLSGVGRRQGSQLSEALVSLYHLY